MAKSKVDPADELKIMCTGEIEVDFHKLKDLQLTNDGRKLKKTDDEKIKKLVNSLREFGIVNNLQVWKKGNEIYCFDAHHRKIAFEILEREGLKIPLLPATRCLAKTKTEAKKLLILKESSNSWIDIDVIEDYLNEINFDFNMAGMTIEIPNFDFNFDQDDGVEITEDNSGPPKESTKENQCPKCNYEW